MSDISLPPLQVTQPTSRQTHVGVTCVLQLLTHVMLAYPICAPFWGGNPQYRHAPVTVGPDVVSTRQYVTSDTSPGN